MMLLIQIVGWSLVAAILSTFVIETAFMTVASAKRVRDLGLRMPLSMRMTVKLWRVVGGPADVVYNVLAGTIQFRELPHELTFSSRVDRHYNGAMRGERFERARFWFKILNAIWPEHVKDRVGSVDD